MRPVRVLGAALAVVCGLASAGCGEKPKTNPFETKKDTVEPPPIKEPPKPQGPPEFTVGQEGPKVGWTYVLLDKPEGKAKLESELATNKEWIAGKTVPLRADRKAKLAHVAEMVRALGGAGATGVEVATDTRPEFPKAVTLSGLAENKNAPGCSVVAKVLTERRNAVWSLKGGTAVKSPKGLAGPDMAMTQTSLANAATRCKDSNVVFVSGDEDVEWGLVFDLAASTRNLDKVSIARVVLLEPAPVAGRPVKLD
jgi:biopolymer transport protein ExbD